MEKHEKINRATITRHLIEYELEMVGKTMIDTFDDDKWYIHFTMTRTQLQEFHDYTVPLIMKVFHCPKPKAEETFKWFREMFGLKIKGL